jgi:hypothetical protein
MTFGMLMPASGFTLSTTILLVICMKTINTKIPKISLILTNHSKERIEGRMPLSFHLPEIGTYVRILTATDLLYNRKIFLLRVKHGTILGKWVSGANKFLIKTLFDDEIFRRLQNRKKSRFLPYATACYQIDKIISAAWEEEPPVNIA